MDLKGSGGLPYPFLAIAAFPAPPPLRGKCKNPFNTLWVVFIYCKLEVYSREGFLSFTFLSHSFSETGYPIWYLWCSQVNKVRWRALKNSKLWLDLLLWERSISVQQSWLTMVLFCGVSCCFTYLGLLPWKWLRCHTLQWTCTQSDKGRSSEFSSLNDVLETKNAPWKELVLVLLSLLTLNFYVFWCDCIPMILMM